MRKRDELLGVHTCMSHAHENEMVFVLLSRDAAAPVAIRAWVAERLRSGKNVDTDLQIVEAIECARVMENEGRKWVGLCDRCGGDGELTIDVLRNGNEHDTETHECPVCRGTGRQP